MSASPRPALYPFPTELRPLENKGAKNTGGYSIFLTALRHQVNLAALPSWWQDTRKLGWRLHEYLANPKGNPLSGRRFEPARVLSPAAATPLLGETFPLKPIEADEKGQQQLVKRRLDPKDTGCRRCETLLLSLEGYHPERMLGRPLRINDRTVDFVFHIEWVDLWLMPGGLGLLAFKALLNSVLIKGEEHPPRVGDLGHLNRLIRYIQKQDEDAPEPGVCPHGEAVQHETTLWRGIVSERWLGLGAQSNLLRLEPGANPWADSYTSYAKTLTAARIAPIEAGDTEILWNWPQTDPPLDATKAREALACGNWRDELSAWQRGAIAEYPTLGDVLLYELASTSAEGAAAGLNGARDWQVSTDYLRALFRASEIAIWEYWKGLALRDTCAFLAFDDSMPILHQAESYYYPLYAHTYYTQCRLHALSEAIIDHDLRNVRNARLIRDTFTAFRNQYWFRETATGFQGIEIARQMHRGMELDELYDSVASEVAEVGEFIDNKIHAGRQALLGLLIVLFYPLTVLWGIFEDDVLHWFAGLDPFWTAVAALGMGVIVLGGLAVAANRLGALAQRLSDWMWKRHL